MKPGLSPKAGVGYGKKKGCQKCGIYHPIADMKMISTGKSTEWRCKSCQA